MPNLIYGRHTKEGVFREDCVFFRDQVGLLDDKKATDHLALSEGLENTLLGAT